MSDDVMVDSIRKILSSCRGPENAITLADLANHVGVSRREVEQIIEHHLSEFPFVLVAGANGLHIPASADEVNRYITSLHRRHRRMQIREATIRRKARACGYPEERGRFIDPPQVGQMELF